MPGSSWPEVEDPTERMPRHWFEEVEAKLLELEWLETTDEQRPS